MGFWPEHGHTVHLNSFLQSTPVLVVAAATCALLVVVSTMLRSSRERARRVVTHRAEVGSTPAHGLGLVVFSPVGTLGLGSVTAFFVLQLVGPQYDGLGRPVVVHFELLVAGAVLLGAWWLLAYVPRAPSWMFPRWARVGEERRLSIVAHRLVGGPGPR